MLAFLGLGLFVNAQTTTPLSAKTAAVARPADTKIKPVVKTTAPAVKQETSVAAHSVAGSVPLKKDGTPDRRYKANKKAASGPLKKDGTHDKRYKKNKGR